MTPPILITAGDPEGIGPEVAVKAARELALPAILVGDASAMHRWDASLPLVDSLDAVRELSIYEPPSGEPVEVSAIRVAAQACLANKASAMVTGPIHKGRLAEKGFKYKGHTDFLGALCEAEPMMAFVGRGLRVGLATTHIPLAAVPGAVTAQRLERCIRLCDQGLGQLGLPRRQSPHFISPDIPTPPLYLLPPNINPPLHPLLPLFSPSSSPYLNGRAKLNV